MTLPGRRQRTKALLAAFAVLAAGCAETEESIDRNARTIGASIGGAAVGVMAGEAIGATAAEGGLGAAGAIVGMAAGPYLKKRDVVYFDKAIDIAAESKPGTPIHWTNPNTGTTGVMTRGKDVDIDVSLTCRKLRSEERKPGEIEVENMVVCRPDLGTWYIRSSWLEDSQPVPPKKTSGAKPTR
jgi:hypothetical protein